MADANKGRDFLQSTAQERPRTVNAIQLLPELLHVYRNGYLSGETTGWPNLDQFYTVALGQITTITGYPNSGKSQFMDALALNLARRGWCGTFCSLENLPAFMHTEKLLKQYLGKPFREGIHARMTEAEVQEAAHDICDWFSFVVPGEKKPNPSLYDVLEIIEDDFKERGLWKLPGAKLFAVIDPWNELEHFRPSGVSLTEYIGHSLSVLRQWTRQHLVHLFVVAHPAKQLKGRDTGSLPTVTPDMISDSAHFWNKSDNCITVEQDSGASMSREVNIHVQKVRFAHIGQKGMAKLLFDNVSGRYSPKLEAVK